ncbi:MAG: sugar phosphate isomerase/epimerase [Bacteroidia bacterium]|nr:sugar phosphate isomerase/epimerase [Bacteroidia bacterium]
MNRRNFIASSSLAAAGIATGFSPLLASPTAKLKNIGVILGLLNKEMQADYKATLKAVAETGYKYLEFGGTYGADPKEFLQVIKDLGLKPIAGGTSIVNLRKQLPEMIETYMAQGKKYLVCYWPWDHDGTKVSGVDEVKRIAAEFNEIGEKCRQGGIQFVFHNHDKEFFPVEGQLPYDIILDETDPALVGMEIDLYWIAKGGADPIPYFKKYPGRFEICHVKDMDNTPEKSFETPGKGIIDFPSIFAHIKTAGLKYFIVERDKAPEPMRTMREGYEYLRGLRF